MMDANQYQKECLRTECDQTVAMRRYMSEMAIRLNHSVLGLTGEVGELATAVEKWLHYGRTLDLGNLIEEFGDCLWYLCLGMSAVGIKMEHVMEANLRKLKTRYPDRYTDERAAHRDLEAEKKVMRTTEEVKQARRGPGGCCERYANHQACNCLDLAFDSRRGTDFTISQEANVGDQPRGDVTGLFPQSASADPDGLRSDEEHKLGREGDRSGS
jgi:NTP pyrophosphatase (non-canonical NTP hydrolase)